MNGGGYNEWFLKFFYLFGCYVFYWGAGNGDNLSRVITAGNWTCDFMITNHYITAAAINLRHVKTTGVLTKLISPPYWKSSRSQGVQRYCPSGTRDLGRMRSLHSPCPCIFKHTRTQLHRHWLIPTKHTSCLQPSSVKDWLHYELSLSFQFCCMLLAVVVVVVVVESTD